MAATPYPLPRAARETEILDGDGSTTVFGPFAFKIFDIEDVEVQVRQPSAALFSPVAVTVAKTSSDAFAFFTVTFDTAPVDGAEIIVLGKREAERSVAVTKGGTISGNALEMELSKQAVMLSELSRHISRAFVSDFGAVGGFVEPIDEGHFWKADAAGNMVDGGSGADIAAAQANAAAARADRILAEAARDLALAAVPVPKCDTRTVLAALPVSFTHAWLTEAGREGLFKRVTAVSVAGWVTADPQGGVVVPSTADASYTWQRVGYIWHDARWWGVAGGDAADENAETLAALTFLAYAGGSIRFPRQVRLDSQVHVNGSSNGYNIREGSFIVNNTTGGLKFTLTSVQHRVEVTGVTFIAGVSLSGRPIHAVFPAEAAWRQQTLLLQDINLLCRVYDDSNYRWGLGILIENAFHFNVNRLYCNGGHNGSVLEDLVVVTADGRSINGQWDWIYCTNVGTGIKVTDDAEGQRFTGVNVVGGRRGVVLDDNTAGNPWATFNYCHFNVNERGIYAADWQAVMVQHCLFYRLANVAGYKDIEISDSEGSSVTNCAAYLGASSENWFVHATNCTGLRVKDNRLSERWHHVQLEGTSANCIAEDNPSQNQPGGATEGDAMVNNASGAGNRLLHWRAKQTNTVILSATGSAAANDLANGVATSITWDSVALYNEQVGFASGSPTIVTVPAWVKSVSVYAQIEFPSNGTGYRSAVVRRAGTGVLVSTQQAVTGTVTALVIAGRFTVTAGQQLDIQATQNSGGNLQCGAGRTRAEFIFHGS